MRHDELLMLEFRRRRRVAIGTAAAWVVTPEDLILSKLDWSRESGSELQRRDIEVMLQTVPALDWEYLEKWAAVLDVSRELQRARKT